jgi:hypothetical protein
MAVPAWPDGVPYAPDLNTVQPLVPFLDPIKTEMEGGNTRLRSRPGDNVGQIQYSVPMSTAQMGILKDWVKNTIGNGTGRFTLQVWLDNAFVSKVCQFASVPKSQRLANGRLASQLSLKVYDI